MTAYAIAHLRTVEQNDAVVRYLQEIDATLAPYEGAFVIHGATPEVLEGPFPGTLVAIAFPDLAAARAWYGSDAYRELIPLRAEHSDGSVILISGCDATHKATDVIGPDWGGGV